MLTNCYHIQNKFGSCWILPILHNGPRYDWKNCPFPQKIHLIPGSLVQSEPIPLSTSIGSAIFVKLTFLTNTHTHTHTHTHTGHICNNRSHICTVCTWWCLKIHRYLKDSLSTTSNDSASEQMYLTSKELSWFTLELAASSCTSCFSLSSCKTSKTIPNTEYMYL